jgi:hypothetical protein
MRRLMAWFAGGLVLVGGTFGTFALIETSMASAAPSAACLYAEQSVQQAELGLYFVQALGSILALGGPYQRAEVAALIKHAEEQLQAAEATESIACRTITPTGSPTLSISTSSSKTTTSSTTTTTTGIMTFTTPSAP